MGQLSICSRCERLVHTDDSYDEDYVVVETNNKNETLMHAKCYEAEMDEKEAKVTPMQQVG